MPVSRSIQSAALAAQKAREEALRAAQPYAAFGGINPDALKIQELVQTNFDPSKATPQEIIDQNRGMALAEATLAPPVDQRKPVGAPSISPLSGAMGQAGATGSTAGRPAVGEIEKNAIQRLVESGMTPEQAKVQFDAQKPFIQETMSNTGQGYVPAGILNLDQAQSILLTSRNAADRKAAQTFIDNHISAVKGYAPRQNIDQGTGLSFTTYSEDPEATKIAQEAERNRLTIETQNKMKAQEQKTAQEQMRPVIDTGKAETLKTYDDSIAILEGMKTLQGISPEIISAYAPSILSRIIAAKQAKADAEALRSYNIENSPLVKSALTLATVREATLNARFIEDRRINEEGKAIALEANRLAGEMMLSDKKSFEMKARETEVKQAKINMENEKQLRRGISSIGGEPGLVAIEYMQGKIQEAADVLTNMREQNAENLLKFDIAHSQLANNVRSILSDFDSRRAVLNSTYDDNVFKLDEFTTTTRAGVYKDIRLQIKDLTDKEDKLMTEAGDKLATAAKDATEAMNKVRDDERADKKLQQEWEREDMKLKTAEFLATHKENLAQEKAELADARIIIADINAAKKSPSVIRYLEIKVNADEMSTVLARAVASNNAQDIGAAIQLVVTKFAKGIDPTTGVREGEFERMGLSQTVIGKVQAVWKMLKGGDMTGLSVDMAQSFVDAMATVEGADRNAAIEALTPSINRIVTHNSSAEYNFLDPLTAIPPSMLIDFEYVLQNYQDVQKSTPVYDWNGDGTVFDSGVTTPLQQALPDIGLTYDDIFNAYEEGTLQPYSSLQSGFINGHEGDGITSAGTLISSLGRTTQSYGTNLGEIYSELTQKAWGGKHLGIDIAMNNGTFIPNLSGGILKSVEYNKKGWGLSVVIKDDNGAEHRYSHLSSVDPNLKIGQYISRGKEFATSGNSGLSTGPHLDYRIRKDGKYIDPFTYII